jgi:serine/threonine protein kinase
MLSGRPPFEGSDSEEIMEKIKKGKFSFQQPIWKHFSPLVQELITQMLKYDPKSRLTA